MNANNPVDKIEEIDELEQHLSDESRESLKKLKDIQTEFNTIEKEYLAEMRKLRSKYEAQYDQIYTKRDQILESGTVEESGTPGLPQFWITAMRNSRMLGSAIEEYDVPILSYLKNITTEWTSDQQSGFILNFNFVPNPFFEGTNIKKEYVMVFLEDDEPLLSNTVVSKIEWKQGKDPTQEVVVRRQRHKQSKEVRIVTETVHRESFFNFFKSLNVPSDEELAKMDRFDIMELESTVETDYEMGVFIRDKLIPYSLYWFTGEAVDEDDELEEDDEGDIVNVDDDDSESESESGSDSNIGTDSDSEDDRNNKNANRNNKKNLFGNMSTAKSFKKTN
ncbi:nucleosome assembly protein [Cryptosporidium ubiquitum]|uniref:Nucleosome assembly protein n=1 Tax=Cryptosporidium ubiquitum TaxID=857276 RepID=A0A1J4MBV0_9CRYT|nr:nucleosome assembly protein [Cryptosporidium ubiquitum]OII71704.1 nucleosome assembly protein [Cryptosporidium ubiquitum]